MDGRCCCSQRPNQWTKKEKSKLLHERVQSHDREFDPTIYGIDKFEARVLQRWNHFSKAHEGIISASLIFKPLNRHLIPLKTGKVPYSRRFTWEALVKYIASSPIGDESVQDHHWKLQSYHCGLCSVDYDIITHLEHAESETKWILELLNLTGSLPVK